MKKSILSSIVLTLLTSSFSSVFACTLVMDYAQGKFSPEGEQDIFEILERKGYEVKKLNDSFFPLKSETVDGYFTNSKESKIYVLNYMNDLSEDKIGNRFFWTCSVKASFFSYEKGQNGITKQRLYRTMLPSSVEIPNNLYSAGRRKAWCEQYLIDKYIQDIPFCSGTN